METLPSQRETSMASRPNSHRSDKSSLGIIQFGFHAKTSFDATDALLQTRSDKLKLKDGEKDNDIWKKPPPDFRVNIFDPKPPKRNTVDSMQPWRYGTIPGERFQYKRQKASLLPVIFRQSNSAEGEFQTRFRTMRPFTAKRKHVTEGMYEAGEYVTPQKHDFRGYPPIKTLGLPEFRSDSDRDPYNIKFNSERLGTVTGMTQGCVERDMVEGRQMGRAMSAKPHYDSKLILPNPQWPTKSGAYTRHRRRNRQAYSAFMERVEEQLVTQWAREKMNQALSDCTNNKSVDVS